jgi:uncharacterized glyoxalase superfamily metalloenzyme YdcJ
MRDSFLNCDMLRLAFSENLSKMFKAEVPAYGTLLHLVADVNQTNDIRLNRERHGAIRLGLPSELTFIKRLFAVYGMYPVNYYNLSVAGIPVHSTAFRPINLQSLEFCPFRIFTSLLKLDFITDPAVYAKAFDMLNRRSFIPVGIEDLIMKAERQQGLYSEDADKFINLSLKIFAFNPQATTDYQTYQTLKNSHPLIADIVCFQNPHINHLTPRTLDIDAVQKMMPDYHINPKAIIEGPPPRKIPILLRQTSFKALPETVYFTCGTQTNHTARFGEVEQRGFSLSPKGRSLYDYLLSKVNNAIFVLPDASNTDAYYTLLNEVFVDFPDSMGSLIADDLLKLSPEGKPQTYEDFLPVSAAGIFTSNLGYKNTVHTTPDDYALFCKYLEDTPLML